jgi:hypothetical protein
MTMVLPLLTNIPESETSHVQPILAMDPSSAFHQAKAVMDCPLKRWKGVMFDDKAKVGALIQRACAFKKQKLADCYDSPIVLPDLGVRGVLMNDNGYTGRS